MAVDRRTVLQNAQLFASKGQYEAAIAEWRKLTTDTPADGTIFNSIGDLQLKRNATPDAVAAFLQAAGAFRSEGSVLKAIAAYKKILKVDPTKIDIYRHLGDLNAERGLLSSAVQDYLTLGKHYFKDGRNKEALEIYRKIISQDPSNLDAQLRVAELCEQEQLVDEAIRVYLQLGRERSAAQQYEQANAMYAAVLRLNPENAEAKEIVTMIEAGGGVPLNLARVAKPFAAAAKPGEGSDLMAEATRRIEEGQYAGAEAMLTQLLSREPGNPEICQLLARLHLLQGNLQVALGEYRFLAGAALRAQDYAMAESLMNDYLKVEPASVPMLELLGELYQEKGDAATAAQHFGRAVEILLEHPEPGMPTLPAELFEKVQALAPGSAIARKLAPAFDPTASSSTEPEVTEPMVMTPEPVAIQLEPEPQRARAASGRNRRRRPLDRQRSLRFGDGRERGRGAPGAGRPSHLLRQTPHGAGKNHRTLDAQCSSGARSRHRTARLRGVRPDFQYVHKSGSRPGGRSGRITRGARVDHAADVCDRRHYG